MKPKIFIGSSKEGLAIANAIHANLTRDAECTVWKDGFSPSSYTLAELLRMLRNADFGIFVFSPDDISIIRDNTDMVVRDNVLFELGLFIGRLGQERCFFITPDSTALHLPTDLHGINPVHYESNRSDSNWQAAVNPACMQIQRILGELKSFQDTENVPSADVKINKHKLILEKYGEKSILLKGNSMPFKDRIRELGYLKYNGKLQGWITAAINEQKLRKDLQDLL